MNAENWSNGQTLNVEHVTNGGMFQGEGLTMGGTKGITDGAHQATVPAQAATGLTKTFTNKHFGLVHHEMRFSITYRQQCSSPKSCFLFDIQSKIMFFVRSFVSLCIRLTSGATIAVGGAIAGAAKSMDAVEETIPKQNGKCSCFFAQNHLNH